MNKSIKVIFLTKYPEKGASSRYRVYQYLDHFNLFNFRVQALMSDASFKSMYTGGNILKRVTLSLKDYVVRFLFIIKNFNADVIYMQREIFAFGPLWAEKLFKIFGKKLIFDLDDALFINMNSKNNPLKLNKAARVKDIIRMSNLVIAGNSWIRDQCLEIGASDAVHVDVAEKVQFENIDRIVNIPLKALWLGSPTTSKYLLAIQEPLKKIQEEFGLEINIVGGDPNIKYSFKSNCYPWSKEIEYAFLRKSDIGLMPLPMTDWSKGKCGGKARTYMASGLIPIVSAIGYNQDLIKNEVTGFLCHSIDDWYLYLRKIVTDISLHGEIRRLNYQNVRDNFDRIIIAEKIESEILKLVNA